MEGIDILADKLKEFAMLAGFKSNIKKTNIFTKNMKIEIRKTA